MDSTADVRSLALGALAVRGFLGAAPAERGEEMLGQVLEAAHLADEQMLAALEIGADVARALLKEARRGQ